MSRKTISGMFTTLLYIDVIAAHLLRLNFNFIIRLCSLKTLAIKWRLGPFSDSVKSLLFREGIFPIIVRMLYMLYRTLNFNLFWYLLPFYHNPITFQSRARVCLYNNFKLRMTSRAFTELSSVIFFKWRFERVWF